MKTPVPRITSNMNRSAGRTPSCHEGCPRCWGVGNGHGWVCEGVSVSISCPDLSSLPQGSGVMTRRTPNVVSGAVCGMGGYQALWGSGPHIFPQCPGEGTLGSVSEAAVGSVAWRSTNSHRYPHHTVVGMVRGASLLGTLIERLETSTGAPWRGLALS